MPATYEPIATTTLGSASTTITFSSIPATYTDLRLVLVDRGASGSTILVRFNSDSGSNYSRTRLQGDGASASSSQSTNQASVICGNQPSATGVWGMHTVDVFSYAGSTNKTCLVTASEDANGSGTVQRQVALWRSTAAINTLTISASNNFDAGTTAAIYGILKA